MASKTMMFDGYLGRLQRNESDVMIPCHALNGLEAGFREQEVAVGVSRSGSEPGVTDSGEVAQTVRLGVDTNSGE